MSSWIALAVAGQAIGALVVLADKYIVTSARGVPRPFVYAFYTCLLSGVWILVFALGLLPIPYLEQLGVPSLENIQAPTLLVAALSALAAYTFFAALVSIYTALKAADASDVAPVVGAVSAVVSFGLSYALLDARLSPNFLIGLFLLALGTFLVSHLRFSRAVALSAIHAGILFGAHYVIIKGLFNVTSFDNGFFWSRAAFILAALSVLLVPAYLSDIRTGTKSTTKANGIFVLLNKVVAGISTILILKATAMGDVSIVQALGGLQFIFLLLFAMFLGRKTPLECGENILCNEDLYHKAIFIGIITLGFIVLFV